MAMDDDEDDEDDDDNDDNDDDDDGLWIRVPALMSECRRSDQ